MAQRAIREYEGKRIFAHNWARYFGQFQYDFQAASVASGDELRALAAGEGYAWLLQDGLVVKPDMIFGKRGLNGLVYYRNDQPGDVGLEAAARWIDARRAETTTLLSGQQGVLSRFIVEPFVAHAGDAVEGELAVAEGAEGGEEAERGAGVAAEQLGPRRGD